MKRIDNWLRETLQTSSTVAQLVWDLALEALLRSRLSPACAGSCTRLLPHLHWVDPAEPQLPIMEHRWCCLRWRCTRAKGSEFFWGKIIPFLNVKMGLYKSSQRSSACCLGAAWKRLRTGEMSCNGTSGVLFSIVVKRVFEEFFNHSWLLQTQGCNSKLHLRLWHINRSILRLMSCNMLPDAGEVALIDRELFYFEHVWEDKENIIK